MLVARIDWLPQILPTLPSQRLYPLCPGRQPQPVDSLLEDIQKIQNYQVQLKLQTVYNKDGVVAEEDYSVYLQFPNREIQQLVHEIVAPQDLNDVKAYEILRWVQDNITYESDIENYGRLEYWALPTQTLRRGCGDCEDEAFLIHSLMLNAGVPWERIRTYGGLVDAGAGAPAGGHGWTVYKRETDNEWVVLDACYYPTKTPIADRVPMRDDLKYEDDFFYTNLTSTRDTSACNTLRLVGTRVNVYA